MVTPETSPDIPNSDIDWIPLRKIITDHRVNTRPVDYTWVDQRVLTFDPDKLGVPIVSARDNGTYACLDGQNRIELCRRVGWSDQKIQCKVFSGLNEAQEAILFLGHNDNRQVKPFHKFVARRTAGDKDAVAIAEIVEAAGWELSYFVGDKKIAAVKSLESIYKQGHPDMPGGQGAILTATLAIATEAWGYTADAANGQILRGIGFVVFRHQKILDTAALVQKLRKHHGGPMGLYADARGLHGFAGGTVSGCVAERIVEVYNKSRRSGALPPWRAGREHEAE